MRESLKPLVYEAAEKFRKAAAREYPPGIIGLFSLQGALPYGSDAKPEFVVFDVSPRIPGCPCVGPTSPEMRRLSLKYNQKIESPLDLSIMEIRRAAESGRLTEIVT
jgi:5-formaminoimidazole-4-carboxamide-1-(beta)-D-ribofuranosyl 5'-monophosphate synthetase